MVFIDMAGPLSSSSRAYAQSVSEQANRHYDGPATYLNFANFTDWLCICAGSSGLRVRWSRNTF